MLVGGTMQGGGENGMMWKEEDLQHLGGRCKQRDGAEALPLVGFPGLRSAITWASFQMAGMSALVSDSLNN